VSTASGGSTKNITFGNRATVTARRSGTVIGSCFAVDAGHLSERDRLDGHEVTLPRRRDLATP
jgi:hypothetical protein